MADEDADFRRKLEATLSDLLGSIPPMDRPPLVFLNACQSAQTYTEALKAARPVITKADLQAWLNNSLHDSPVLYFHGHGFAPTAANLAEADSTLRFQVLPETTEEELQQAVSEIPADPEKLKLVAFLSKAIDEATGVQGSSPWVVFVLAFYICLKINPDPVTSLGTAIAVAVLMQSAKPGK
jgi:hypothetical protein